MTILCVIGARGGSTSLPGKNIKLLCGKPLIVWSVEHALATSEVDRLVVSTDSQEIARVVTAAGALAELLRPELLDAVFHGEVGEDALLEAFLAR